MSAKWLLTALIAILVLPAYSEEAVNNTDIELAGGSSFKACGGTSPSQFKLDQKVLS